MLFYGFINKFCLLFKLGCGMLWIVDDVDWVI